MVMGRHDQTTKMPMEPRGTTVLNIASGSTVRIGQGALQSIPGQQPRKKSGAPDVSATGGVAALGFALHRNLGAARGSGST